MPLPAFPPRPEAHRSALADFAAVWVVDFEYRACDGGDPPQVVCLVARELHTGAALRLWRDELLALSAAPFDVGPNALFVAHNTPAEFSCFNALGWPLPVNVFDTFVEYRNLRNGELANTKGAYSLLGLLRFYGVETIDVDEKEAMRRLILDQEIWTQAQRAAILDYCATDVDPLAEILPEMAAAVDWPQALLRGRYMAALSWVEYHGLPVDKDALARLLGRWGRVRNLLIEEVDADYDVFEGSSWSDRKFAAYLARHNLPWDYTETGRLQTKKDFFSDMAKLYPQLQPLHELRKTLGQMRKFEVPVGRDGRSRCSLFPFGSLTGRNQPKTKEFIFQNAKWLRGLVRPGPGRALIYADWVSQEIGIGAYLSGDPAMVEAYESGDAYTYFGIQCGELPTGATKESHPDERALFKMLMLGINYGMGAAGLAARTGCTESRAKQLLRHHRRVYRHYWQWAERLAEKAYIEDGLQTCFGWRRRVGTGAVNHRSWLNHPLQSHGGEMLRIATILAAERGLMMVAPLHDGIFFECAAADLDRTTERVLDVLQRASRSVLKGNQLGADVEVSIYPQRLLCDKGTPMWDQVQRLVDAAEPVSMAEAAG